MRSPHRYRWSLVLALLVLLIAATSGRTSSAQAAVVAEDFTVTLGEGWVSQAQLT